MIKAKRFLIGIGAFFIMLLSLLFLFNPPIIAHASVINGTDIDPEVDSSSYSGGVTIYSGGSHVDGDSTGYSLLMTSFDMSTFQYERMKIRNYHSTGPSGTFYFIRTKDIEVYNKAKAQRDNFVAGTSSGGNYQVDTTTSFFEENSSKMEYLTVKWDFESESFDFIGSNSRVKGEAKFEYDEETGAENIAIFYAYFFDTVETVKETYYYFGMYSRELSVTKTIGGGNNQTTTHDYFVHSITSVSNKISACLGDELKEVLSNIPRYPNVESENVYSSFYKTLGQYFEEPAQVRLNYKVYDPEQLAIVDKSLTIPFDSIYRNTPEILSTEIAKQLEGFEYNSILVKEALPYFDVDLQELTTYVDENGNQFSSITNDATSLVAEGIEFVNDFEDGNNVVEFNVIYDDYDHSKFYLKLTNNDISNYMELKVNSSDFRISGNKGYLTFDFNTLENQSMVLLKWLYELGINTDGNSFRVTYKGEEISFIKSYDSDNKEVHTYTMEDGGIVVKITDDVNLQLIYNLEEDSIYPAYDIFNVAIEIEANIIEDYLVVFEYTYKTFRLEGTEIVIREIVSRDPEVMPYSSARMFQNADNVKTYYSEVVSAIDLPFKYATISSSADEYDGGLSNIKIEGTNEYYRIYGVRLNYTYSPVFMVTQQLPTGDTVKYFNISKLNSLYTGLDFVDQIPDGYRVSKIYSRNQTAVETIMPSSSILNPTWLDVNYYLNVKTDDQVIIQIVVEYSNMYNVRLRYLKKYNDSPFGTYQSIGFNVPVAENSEFKEYEKVDDDGERLTLNAPILKPLSKAYIEEVSQTNIDGLNAGINSISSKWTSTTQDLYVNYGGRTVVQSVPNGANISRTIPLTSFGAWCDALGVKWDIMFLNTSTASHGASTYFERADEVNPYDLYGFFTLATFSKSAPWNKLSDVELDSDFAVMTYFVDRYFGSDIRGITNTLKVQTLGETAENSTSKDYSTFFAFIDTNFARDGFVSVDGVENIKDATKTSSGGCSFGLFSCDNVGNVLFTVLICLAVVVVVILVIKGVRWATGK